MNTTNITELAPLEALERTPQIILMILYSTTAIVSLASNSTVILVLVFGKKSSNELKKFLINLAIADMCMASLSIPFTYTDFMFGRWIFPSLLCKFYSIIFFEKCQQKKPTFSFN
jgi:Na+/H+ antiporter NhaA